jgi:hypothetical protein
VQGGNADIESSKGVEDWSRMDVLVCCVARGALSTGTRSCLRWSRGREEDNGAARNLEYTKKVLAFRRMQVSSRIGPARARNGGRRR